LVEFTSFFTQIRTIVDLLVPLVFTLALLGFFWGLARYLFAGTDEGKVAGKQIMVWGIVALFVMASVWGLVAFIQNLIGVDATSTQVVPTVQ
jgi:hypothetical protein